MNTNHTEQYTESLWVQILKILLLSLSAFGYTWPLVTGAAHAVVVAAVIVASLIAFLFARMRLRMIWCALGSVVLMSVGLIGSYMTLDVIGMMDFDTTIKTSRFWYYAGLVFGLVFLSRSLSLRYRTAQIIESCLIIGTLVFLFFAHRDFDLTSPREFADYLYGNGYDPIEVYRWMGIGSAFLALPMLFGRVKPVRAITSMALLVLIALMVAFLVKDARLPLNVEDPLGLNSTEDKQNNSSDNNDDNNDEDKDKEQNNSGNNDQNADNNNGGGNNSNNNQGPTGNEDPKPVAIAVFYDEYEPGDGIFHFRQTVLSHYDGNHLVGSDMDDDVISSMPLTGALDAVPVQSETLHEKISTSMFLFKEHSQPPQLAMGQHVFPIQNPDPKLFVSAYGVDSLGLSIDLVRLLGRHSIPMEWTEEKKSHYLAIPDDPRYKALSDIIVRKIDPRFIGDDVVKALYIKSWLEKEGYYTMKTKHIDASDPTASFLFGSLRGYCVHFAHSAVYLLRSQGIAARVALGYAIDNRLRGTNSAVLIMGNQAHAWPEIYLDGVGWVTLEIFPENGDEPPRDFVKQDLESLFGELARDDKSGGKSPEARKEAFQLPWKQIWCGFGLLLILALLGCYVRKAYILISAHSCHSESDAYKVLRGTIYVWCMYGHNWRNYHTLEAFAADKVGAHSATGKIVRIASAPKLGGSLTNAQLESLADLYKSARREAAENTSLVRRILGWLNPIVLI